MVDSFQFRSFFVIAFELLEVNLYKYMKAPDFKGMSNEKIRQIAT